MGSVLGIFEARILWEQAATLWTVEYTFELGFQLESVTF